jgi:hypothetical protein
MCDSGTFEGLAKDLTEPVGEPCARTSIVRKIDPAPGGLSPAESRADVIQWYRDSPRGCPVQAAITATFREILLTRLRLPSPIAQCTVKPVECAR